MKFSELKECPFCGCEEYYEKQKATGSVHYRSRFDGEEADNEDMYIDVFCKSTGRVYCVKCNKALGNVYSDTLMRQVENQLINRKSCCKRNDESEDNDNA